MCCFAVIMKESTNAFGRNRDRLCFHRRLCTDRRRASGNGHDRYDLKTGSGVLHNDVSAEFESFQDNLLEYPQYSGPEEWRGKKVPPILLSGHHANIEKWRREQSILRTMERRPDLLKESNLTDKEKKWIRQVKRERKEAEKNEIGT